jgi:hypothetical protein
MPWAGRLFHLKNGTAFVHDATLRKFRCPARTSGSSRFGPAHENAPPEAGLSRSMEGRNANAALTDDLSYIRTTATSDDHTEGGGPSSD